MLILWGTSLSSDELLTAYKTWIGNYMMATNWAQRRQYIQPIQAIETRTLEKTAVDTNYLYILSREIRETQGPRHITSKIERCVNGTYAVQLFLLLRKANPNVALHAIEDALACEQLNGIETNLGIKLVDSLRDPTSNENPLSRAVVKEFILRFTNSTDYSVLFACIDALVAEPRDDRRPLDKQIGLSLMKRVLDDTKSHMIKESTYTTFIKMGATELQDDYLAWVASVSADTNVSHATRSLLNHRARWHAGRALQKMYNTCNSTTQVETTGIGH
jgi:hypothetical protein